MAEVACHDDVRAAPESSLPQPRHRHDVGTRHIGYTIPPQADCGWVGEVGPGPSYGDPVESDSADGPATPAGYDSEFTNKNTTFMTWNLIHLARMLKDAGGYPAHGNTPDWKTVPNATDGTPKAD